MIGKKVKYNGEIYEIEVLSKDFINQIYKYKLKGLDDILFFKDFEVIEEKIEDVIEEINEIIDDNTEKLVDNTEKLDDNIVNSDSDYYSMTLFLLLKRLIKTLKKKLKIKRNNIYDNN